MNIQKALITLGTAVSLLFPSTLLAGGAKTVWVNSYTKSDGTYVSGYWRSPPSGSSSDNSYYPSYTPRYTTQTVPIPTFDPGHWETERTVNFKGQVFYNAERHSETFDGFSRSEMWFLYSCFPGSAGSQREESISLGVTKEGYSPKADRWIASIGDDNPVHVYAVIGSFSVLLPSWEAKVLDSGMLLLHKATNGLTWPDQIGGVSFLTQAYVDNILQADEIYVLVKKADGNIDSYKIQMNGFAIAVQSIGEAGCTAG